MARKPEAVFSDWIRDGLIDVDITRVESRASLGFPDMVIVDKSGTGKVCFLENKVVQRGLKIDLRPHQVSFLFRHWKYGCSTFVLVKHLPVGKRVAMINLYSGGQVMELLENGLRVDPIFRYPSNGMDWEQLTSTLLGLEN
jgi:hypothetical protein